MNAALHPAGTAALAGDAQALRRAVSAIGVVGVIDGHDVIRRASAIEIVSRREPLMFAMWNALLKACGDDADMAAGYIESEMQQ